MKLSALKTLAASLVLAAALAGSAFATSIGGASVNTALLNFRAQPSTASAILTSVPQGSVVVVGAKTNSQWYKVVYKGAVGYMSAKYLSFSEVLEGNFGTGNTYGVGVNMRSAPSLSATVIGKFSNGVKMTVLGVYGGWYKVQYGTMTGYIYSDYFSLNGGVSGITQSAASMGDTIVATAKKYLGTPYVWGGTSTSGFDCSGLVYYVYKENGYTINRTAATIYNNGVAVDREDLQAGDVICFSNSSGSGIGHVGIYIGDGQFIHSSSSDGCVIISSLSTSYYNNHYVAARRIV
ncbi:MAG: CHAP domain-containing protein [Clostridia bacterium]|nr:CHAP domain-containing protein [Clostridia bacterium]